MKTTLTRRHFLAASAASVLPAAAGASVIDRGSGWFSMLDSSQPQTAPHEDWQNSGVIDLSRSPHARLKTVPPRAVTVGTGFWQKRRQTNVDSSIPSMHDELIEHGRLDNFLRLEGSRMRRSAVRCIRIRISTNGWRRLGLRCKPAVSRNCRRRPRP